MGSLEARIAELGELTEGWTREALRGAVEAPAERFGAMLEYHLGWRGEDLQPLAQPAAAGKKLRSAMVLLVCEAVCGSIEPARHAAVAVELLHNFSLVHDDIQDESDLRRHRPTLWKLWGIAQGINAGDALFTLAQLTVLRGTDGRGTLGGPLAAELNSTCLRLVEGQYLDIELQAGRVPPTIQTYEAMIARKTAALFASACRLGALAGGADAERQAQLGQFGHHLGMGFQEQDDLLGVWGTAAETGKPQAADVVVRKKGLPAVLALAQPDAPEWLRAIHSADGPLPPTEVARVVRHLDTVGVHAQVESRVASHFEAATAALAAAGGHEPARSHLAALAGSLVARRT